MLHTLTLQGIRVGTCCIGLAGMVHATLGQTNVEADVPAPESLHNLKPLAGSLRLALWFLGAALLAIAGVVLTLRSRMATSLYGVSSDAHWTVDSQEDAGERLAATEVLGACEVLEHSGKPGEHAPAQPKPEQSHHTRLFTPASGAAWNESMLKAFLSTCMKVNCLGRVWREMAARQVQALNMPDPREAELIRRLMQRWQEFHVDPDSGVFLEHSTPEGKSRVCIIGVTRDKHTLVEAAFNAGFVIETLGRYLRSTDLVCRRGLGEYHAPTKEELAAMTPGEKQSLIRITEIPEPWQAMIASSSAASR